MAHCQYKSENPVHKLSMNEQTPPKRGPGNSQQEYRKNVIKMISNSDKSTKYVSTTKNDKP